MLNLIDSFWFSFICSGLSLSLLHLHKLRVFFLRLLFFLHLRFSSVIELDVPLQKAKDELLLVVRFLLSTYLLSEPFTLFILVVFSWCINSLYLITVFGLSFIISHTSYSGISNNRSSPPPPSPA